MSELTLPRFPRSKMFINLEQQIMSKEWLDFLQALFSRVGGQSSTIPDVGPLTANRITATDADTELGSVNDLTDWIKTVTNQLVATDNGDGTETLGLADNPTLIKVSGGGIKVDLTTPTFGWRDLLGNITNAKGANKPTEATYRDSIQAFQFGAGDDAILEFHIPHDYVPGTDIHLHVHWSHNSAIVTGGNIVFTYEITYAKGHNQAAFPASVGTTFTGTASTTQYQHIISEVQISATSPSANQIDSDNLEPDGVILCRLEMTTNNITSGGAVPDPFIHYIDIHYQSTNIATKAKAPDFYT